MKLATFHCDGCDRIGIVADDESLLDLLPLSALCAREGASDSQACEESRSCFAGDMSRMLAAGDAALDAARRALDFYERNRPATGARGEPIRRLLSSVTLRAPVPRPGKLICVGKNYKSLYKEGEPYNETPAAWLAPTTSIIAHGEPIVRPRRTLELDYEVELAVVIGKRGKYIAEADALSYVAGYTIVNDITDVGLLRAERELRTRLLQKGLDTFTPMGPWLVTSDEVGDPQDLDLRLRVNGEVRQDSNTREMVASVPALISYLSMMTLEPGDVISTGMPWGFAWPRPDAQRCFLKPGDVIEAEVERIGVLCNTVVDEKERT
ncbi:MAG: fumarylacetoacetate hydrolase family protein [Planctomycetota bacterium]